MSHLRRFGMIGSLRFAMEFFRTPDPGIFSDLGFQLSTAQWLCVPMILAGIVILVTADRGSATVSPPSKS